MIALLLWTVLPSSPADTASFLPPHLHSLLILSQPLPNDAPALQPSTPLVRTPTLSAASSRTSSPKPTLPRSPHRLPLLQATAALSIPTPMETLLSPLTVALSVGYMLLLLATTPSAFLPRLLQQRYALSERGSNLLVGIVYAVGGVVQFGVGWLAARRGVGRVWRVVAAGVVVGWMVVGLWEGILVQGQGPIGAPNRKGVVEWDEDGVGNFKRWAGVAMRVVVTMGEPPYTHSSPLNLCTSEYASLMWLTLAIVAFYAPRFPCPSRYSDAHPRITLPVTDSLDPSVSGAPDGNPHSRGRWYVPAMDRGVDATSRELTFFPCSVWKHRRSPRTVNLRLSHPTPFARRTNQQSPADRELEPFWVLALGRTRSTRLLDGSHRVGLMAHL